MAKTKEKKVIVKDNWISRFNVIGQAKIDEYTFKTDEKSEKSSFIYNSLSLNIDCGEKYGIVNCNMMGGYDSEKANVIYAHGKNEDGSDDFKKRIEVDWDDRFNEDILKTIGDMCFITVGLEKTKEEKTYYKKFLNAYDAIKYVKKYIENDTVINVRGSLKYSMYQDKIQVSKDITSIVLSKIDDPSKYSARFTQTILIDKDSASLKNIDKDKGVMYIDARVLDYLKELNGIKLFNAKGEDKGGQYPYPKQFEYEFPDLSNTDQCKKIMDKLFKVKKGVTQITFEGDLIEGGAVVTATLDDVPDDIKELIEIGVYSEEEALARCSSNDNREQRMVLRKPFTKLVGEKKVPTLQIFKEKYTEDDLILDYLANIPDTDEEDDTATETETDTDTSNTESTDVDDMSWLDDLD